MKVAILGSSPIALEAALRLHHHGAALTWFNFNEVEYEGLFPSATTSWDDYTSELGFAVLKDEGSPHVQKELFSWDSWKKNYAQPLSDYLRAHQEVKSYEVVSVTKRFLSPGETLPDKSRFHDLFRLIYQLNPSEFINQQIESNPETYEKLSQELIHSLQSSLEMYEDFDMVLDFRRVTLPTSASVTGRALGEKRVGADYIAYGFEAFKKAHAIAQNIENREIAILGSNDLAVEMILILENWLKDPHTRLFVVTTEEEPFKRFFKIAAPKTAEKLNNLLAHMDQEFENEVQTFTTKLKSWLQLDDFVQVKIPKPAEPIPRLNFFSGHNVTAFDQLIDKRRLFLTLEKPDFRHGKAHPENNHLDLKTLGVDQIFVASRLSCAPICQLDSEEKGFFLCHPTRPTHSDFWKRDLIRLKGIEDEIFKLFSPHNSGE